MGEGLILLDTWSDQTPESQIDGKPARLTCENLLTRIDLTKNFHAEHNCRHPFALYNISSEKVLRRLKKFIDAAIFASRVGRLKDLRDELLEDIPDLVEAVLYASSEHVDDVRMIFDTFYLPEATHKSKAQTRPYIEMLKSKKSQITSLANNIKHNHGRIRIFGGELAREKEVDVLLGFTCESYIDGGLGPNPHFHEKFGNIVSLSAFAWEHLLFLWDVSNIVQQFLEKCTHQLSDTELMVNPIPFTDVFHRLLDLPLYSFDTAHPINNRKIRINGKIRPHVIARDLLGSIYLPWNKTDLSRAEPGGFSMMFRGDGATKKFHLAMPRSFTLIHWQQFPE